MESSDVRDFIRDVQGNFNFNWPHTSNPAIFEAWSLQKRPGWGGRGSKYFYVQGRWNTILSKTTQETTVFFFFFFFFFCCCFLCIFAIKHGNKAFKPDCTSFFVCTCFALIGNCCAFLMIFNTVMRPSQGFWGTGEQGQFFQGNRGTKA